MSQVPTQQESINTDWNAKTFASQLLWVWVMAQQLVEPILEPLRKSAKRLPSVNVIGAELPVLWLKFKSAMTLAGVDEVYPRIRGGPIRLLCAEMGVAMGSFLARMAELQFDVIKHRLVVVTFDDIVQSHGFFPFALDVKGIKKLVKKGVLVKSTVFDNCGYCKKRLLRGSKCSKCRLVWYCSRPCQRSHWVVHKKECRTP
jgi:hypothetical protein